MSFEDLMTVTSSGPQNAFNMNPYFNVILRPSMNSNILVRMINELAKHMLKSIHEYPPSGTEGDEFCFKNPLYQPALCLKASSAQDSQCSLSDHDLEENDSYLLRIILPSWKGQPSGYFIYDMQQAQPSSKPPLVSWNHIQGGNRIDGTFELKGYINYEKKLWGIDVYAKRLRLHAPLLSEVVEDEIKEEPSDYNFTS